MNKKKEGVDSGVVGRALDPELAITVLPSDIVRLWAHAGSRRCAHLQNSQFYLVSFLSVR